MEHGTLKRQIHEAETLLLELVDGHETPGAERYVGVLEWEAGSEHSAVSIREQNGQLTSRLRSLEARIETALGTQDNPSQVSGRASDAQSVQQAPAEVARFSSGRQASADEPERSSQPRNSASRSNVGETRETMRVDNRAATSIGSRRLHSWVDDQEGHGRDDHYYSAREPPSTASSSTAVSYRTQQAFTVSVSEPLTARNLGQLLIPSSTSQDSHETIRAGTDTRGPGFIRPRGLR